MQTILVSVLEKLAAASQSAPFDAVKVLPEFSQFLNIRSVILRIDKNLIAVRGLNLPAGVLKLREFGTQSRNEIKERGAVFVAEGVKDNEDGSGSRFRRLKF